MSSPRLSAGATAVAAGALVLAGCGQKGPLYLPEKGGAVVTASPATTPAPPPPPTAPGQPSEPSPTPEPQSTAEPVPADMAAPPKKSDKDEDQQSHQTRFRSP
jgi:predicted small lipoprotein YifL